MKCVHHLGVKKSTAIFTATYRKIYWRPVVAKKSKRSKDTEIKWPSGSFTLTTAGKSGEENSSSSLWYS